MTRKPGASAFTSDIVRITAPTAIAGMLMIVTTVLATTVGRRRFIGALAERLRPAERASEAAVLAQYRAPGVEEEQQEPDADQQHADEIRTPPPGPHTPSECAGKREEERPRGGEPADEDRAEHQHDPEQEAHEIGEQDAAAQCHVAREEVPHHAGAAEARDRHHADAVRGEQLVKSVRRDGDEAGLRCPHEEAEHHEQREHDAR